MSIWTVQTLSHGYVGVHIEDGNVVVHRVANAGEKSDLICKMTADEALRMSRALEQVAFELGRRGVKGEKN